MLRTTGWGVVILAVVGACGGNAESPAPGGPPAPDETGVEARLHALTARVKVDDEPAVHAALGRNRDPAYADLVRRAENNLSTAGEALSEGRIRPADMKPQLLRIAQALLDKAEPLVARADAIRQMVVPDGASTQASSQQQTSAAQSDDVAAAPCTAALAQPGADDASKYQVCETACLGLRGKDMSVCRSAAAILLRVKIPAPNGTTVLARSCVTGMPEACLLAGAGLRSKGEMDAANKVWKIGCDANIIDACVQLAIFDSGSDGFNAAMKACDSGSTTACGVLADKYDQGTGTTKDPARAHALMVKACDGGWGPSCTKLGSYDKGCAAGDTDSCDILCKRGKASAFGGSTRQWLFDNPKIVVLERYGDAVRFHPGLLDLAGAMHTQPRLCGVRKPQQKGRVERAVRYLRDRFFAARSILSVDEGNLDLLDFLQHIAHARPHPRFTDRTVAAVFEEERSRLLKLPDPLPSTDVVDSIVADKTAFVRFDTNLYSVPPEHAHKALTLVACDRTVRLLDGAEPVARHARCWGRHQRVELPEHREAILATKRGARSGKGLERLRAELPGIDTLIERWVIAGRNVGWMIAQTLKLLDLYGADLMSAAVGAAVERGTHDPGALAVLCEQKRRAGNRPLPVELALGAHVPDKDVIPHNLETYDHVQRRHR